MHHGDAVRICHVVFCGATMSSAGSGTRTTEAAALNALFNNIYKFTDTLYVNADSLDSVYEGEDVSNQKRVWAKLKHGWDPSCDGVFDDVYNTYLLGVNGCGPMMLHLATMRSTRTLVIVMEDAHDAVKRTRGGDFVLSLDSPPQSEVDLFLDNASRATYVATFGDLKDKLLRFFDPKTETTAFMMLDIETDGELCNHPTEIEYTRKEARSTTEEFELFASMVGKMRAAIDKPNDEVPIRCYMPDYPNCFTRPRRREFHRPEPITRDLPRNPNQQFKKVENPFMKPRGRVKRDRSSPGKSPPTKNSKLEASFVDKCLI